MRQTSRLLDGRSGLLTRRSACRTEGQEAGAIAVALKTPAGEVTKSGQCKGGRLSWEFKTGDVDLWCALGSDARKAFLRLRQPDAARLPCRYPIHYGAQPVYHVEVTLIGTVCLLA